MSLPYEPYEAYKSYQAHEPYEAHEAGDRLPTERIALVDVLDRVLAGGVVISGDITLSVADVDLVVISLRALVTSVRALAEPTSPESLAAPDAQLAPGASGDTEAE